jgi:hypothetical protein
MPGNLGNQTMPAYDPVNNVFYSRSSDNTVNIVSRTDGSLLGTITLDTATAGAGPLISFAIGYSPEDEWLIVVDYSNDDAVVFDLNGDWVGTSALDIDAQSTYRFGLTNGQLFIYDDAQNGWQGFDIGATPPDGFDGLQVRVTKTFTNGATGDVEVTLTCNGGLPLQQSFTISGGGPGVTFTVNNLPDSGADCEVTESGGPDGYTNNAEVCSWTGVVGGFRSCAITNTPEPSEFAVEIDFDTIEDPAIDLDWDLTVICTPAADSATSTSFPGVTFDVPDGTGSYMNTFEFYADPVNDTNCTATLSGLSSAIEEDGPCTIKGIVVGEADDPATDDVSETPTCTITATAFYEGIPTLSQYGLALMALLMLGVGFIGFRRFV